MLTVRPADAINTDLTSIYRLAKGTGLIVQQTKPTPTAKSLWSLACIISATALGILAVYVYKRFNEYAAGCVGALAISVLIAGLVKTKKTKKDVNVKSIEPLEIQWSVVIQDLQKLWEAKSDSLIKQFDKEKEKFRVEASQVKAGEKSVREYIQVLSKTYDTYHSIDTITGQEEEIRQIHREILKKVRLIATNTKQGFAQNSDFETNFFLLRAEANRLINGDCLPSTIKQVVESYVMIQKTRIELSAPKKPPKENGSRASRRSNKKKSAPIDGYEFTLARWLVSPMTY